MHSLLRPHLRRPITITVVAAVLAIVLTLALATGLDALTSSHTPTGAAGAPPTVQAPAASPEWTLSPFRPLVSGRGALSWTPALP
jgi:hypothetical protein